MNMTKTVLVGLAVLVATNIGTYFATARAAEPQKPPAIGAQMTDKQMLQAIGWYVHEIWKDTSNCRP